MAGRSPLFPTWRYGHRLRWYSRDKWGIVEVVHHPVGLALHFGTSALQGRIDSEHPWLPAVEYLTSMCALAALPSPQSRRTGDAPERPVVSLLGLGTGALAWSMHHLMPHAQLNAFELRPAVIEAGYKLFRLQEVKSLKVIEGDASSMIKALPARSQTLIAIDLFSKDGMAHCLQRADFWTDVERVLHPCGAVALNAWSGDQQALNQILSLIDRSICRSGRRLIIDHERFGNVVILASPRPLSQAECLTRAERIDLSLAKRSPSPTRRLLSLREEIGLSGESVTHRLKRAFESS